jgi:hypothetical protein
MKKILATALLFMLLIAGAWGQPTPSSPPSAESLGLQTPQAGASVQSPPPSESGKSLLATTASSARSAAPRLGAVAPASNQMVLPQGVSVPNQFYIPDTSSTVAGCNFGQWLPMWLNVVGSGPLYSYEWYPSGRLVSQYLSNVRYPGWQKMWFYGDAAGWHTLQYYCSGWSNYIYVYVYGSPYYPGPSPTPSPPSPYPPTPYPPTPYPPTPGCNAQVTVISNWMTDYSVYVDGNYIGGDGQSGDYSDGTFSFTVSGNQQHTIKVYKQGFSYSQTKTYNCGGSYTLTV